MHQTFYIDIDEEITSVVERLRHAKAKEIIIVVPKRALLIQSIVNLRLLKKEGDGLGMQLMIVTQDKLGKLLVEKVGILVQPKLDDVEEDDLLLAGLDEVPGEAPVELGEQEQYAQTGSAPAPISGDPSSRLEQIGSDSFFEYKPQINIRPEAANSLTPAPAAEDDQADHLINKELVKGLPEDLKPKEVRRIDSMQPQPPVTSKPVVSTVDIAVVPKVEAAPAETKELPPPPPSVARDEEIERFFHHEDQAEHEQTVEEKEKKTQLSGKMKKIFWSFGLLLVFVTLTVMAYIFLPKATIALTVKAKDKMVDNIEITGDVNYSDIDYEKETIPAKQISVTAALTKKFPVSGSSADTKTSSSQKARGTIIIYNEFGPNPQPLVATTRFLTEDGKLFRLVKGTTVPGMTKVGDETKPGAIEAEVIADEPGEQYNIEAATFSIPGFKDSGEKYTKFYAKSVKPMTGGGNGGSVTTEKKILNQRDIDSAKSAMRPEIINEAITKINQSADPDPDEAAISTEEPTYKISHSVGDAVEEFEMTMEVQANAVVFNEADLKSVIARMIANSGDGKVKMDGSTISIDYGKPEVDFKLGIITIKGSAKGKIEPTIDLNNLKKGMLGKSHDELIAYLKTYPEIEKADVTYWPPLIATKIPIYENRVDVILDN